MRRRNVLLGFVLLVLGACAPQGPLAPSPPPTLSLVREGSPTLVPPSPSAFHTPATETPQPTVHSIEPEVARVCPPQAQVPFGELGIDPAYRLIIRGVDDAGRPQAMVMSGSDTTPLSIPGTEMQEGWHLSGFGPSPSGRWLQLDYANPALTQYSIWYSSLDGLEQWRVLVLEAGSYTISVSDEEMVLIGVPEEDRSGGYMPWTELAPLVVINPLTGLSQDLPDLPTGALFQFYFSYQDERYAVYDSISDPEYRYYLYSYSDHISTPVFQWLSEVEDPYPTAPATYRGSNGLFGATVSRSYGFDFAIDLTFAEISEDVPYHGIMQPVVLPGRDTISANTAVYGEAENGPFAVTRHRRHTMDPNSFYVFNYRTMTLMDYCLDAYVSPGAQVSGPVSLSPDRRFMAARIEYLTDDQWPIFEPRDTVVLDTATGRFSRLEGCLAVGWAIVDE